MKKLSDYRIREENGKFIIEACIEITERRFLKKVINFEWHQLNVYGEVAGFCRRLDGIYVKVYDTLEVAKAQIIKWCEEPKYHYLRDFERYTYNLPKICPWDLADFYKESLSRADIEYLAKCRAEKERKYKESIKKAQEIADSAIKIINDIAKTEQQMKEEITEKDVVDACKRQFDEKFSIPLTFEAKNMDLQLENAKLKGILETLKKLTK